MAVKRKRAEFAVGRIKSGCPKARWYEFPADSPFRRFPLAEGVTASELDRYLDALSAYYRTDPYRGWFSAFEPLLNGAGASYYAGRTSTAVHTDICSPVATDPT